MKKTALLVIVAHLLSSHLSAQEVGAAAVASAETSSSNRWKNWVFASSALISVAVGITIISLNPGSTSH